MFTTTSVQGIAGAETGELKPAEWLGVGIIPAVHVQHQEEHGGQTEKGRAGETGEKAGVKSRGGTVKTWK